MSTPRHSASTDGPEPDPRKEEILSDIEQTRRELGATVDELSATFDVKARMGEGVHTAKESAVRAAESVTHNVDEQAVRRYGPAVAAGGAAILVLVLFRRRRRTRRQRH